MLGKIKVIVFVGLFCIFSIFSLTGCMSTGPQFNGPEAPPANQSIVYFFRAKGTLTNTTVPGIIHNGTEVMSRLPHQSYWKYYISTGTHQFEPQEFGLYKKGTVTLKNDRPGSVYYVEMVVSFGYIGLELRTESQGIAGIAPCYEVGTDGLGNSAGQNSNKPVKTDVPSEQTASVAESAPAPLKTAAPAPVKAVSPTQAILYVKTMPEDSRIRIMNIKPKFRQGIELAPGKYHIEVSAKGYVTESKWIVLSKGDILDHSVSLSRVPESTTAKATATPEKKILISDPGMTHVADLLKSQNPINKRNGAKIIIRKYPTQSLLLTLAGSELEKGHNMLLNNRYHVDAMAWICKAIGNSGRSEYKSLLIRVADQTRSSKLKKYAQKNAALL